MPLRVVQRVKYTWARTGHVRRSREFMGRHPLLSPEQTKALLRCFLLSKSITDKLSSSLLQCGKASATAGVWETGEAGVTGSGPG